MVSTLDKLFEGGMKVKDILRRLAGEDGEKEVIVLGACDPEYRHCYGGADIVVRENKEGQIEILGKHLYKKAP